MPNEKIQIKANYFAINLAEGIKESSEDVKMLRDVLNRHTSKFTLTKDPTYKDLLKRGIVLGVAAAHNLTTTVGRTIIARLLAGDSTFSGEVNYGAFGNGGRGTHGLAVRRVDRRGPVAFELLGNGPSTR